jgi:hypothetical protein
MEGGGPNPFGHAAVKYTDAYGNVWYFDVSAPDGPGQTAKGSIQVYTEGEFLQKYGDRGWEEVTVPVDPLKEKKVAAEMQKRDNQDYGYNITQKNCTTFACEFIEKAGGKVETDGSRMENPRKYPRDARDGFKAQGGASKIVPKRPKGGSSGAGSKGGSSPSSGSSGSFWSRNRRPPSPERTAPDPTPMPWQWRLPWEPTPFEPKDRCGDWSPPPGL